MKALLALLVSLVYAGCGGQVNDCQAQGAFQACSVLKCGSDYVLLRDDVSVNLGASPDSPDGAETANAFCGIIKTHGGIVGRRSEGRLGAKARRA